MSWLDWLIAYALGCGVTSPVWVPIVLICMSVARRGAWRAGFADGRNAGFVEGRKSERAEAAAPAIWETTPTGYRQRLH